jgi:hypothetical protein
MTYCQSDIQAYNVQLLGRTNQRTMKMALRRTSTESALLVDGEKALDGTGKNLKIG